MTATTKNSRLLMLICMILACALMLTGCGSNDSVEGNREPEGTHTLVDPVVEETDSAGNGGSGLVGLF